MSAGPSARFKLGFALPYSDFVPREEQLRLVKRAEELGYHSVWTAEAYSYDAVTILGWLAAQTSRIHLATGILNVFSRSPALIAMTAAALDDMTGGRFILGLGSSGPKVIQEWHGLKFERFIQRTRETVEICHTVWRREPLNHDGEVFHLHGNLKLVNRPPRADIPIFIAAMGPQNLSMAAEIADGWLPFLYSPKRSHVFRESLEAGAARSGRDLGTLDVMPFVVAAVSDDVEVGRALARPATALYIGGMGTRERNFYNALVTRYGYAEDARTIQDLYLSGRRDEAAAAVPDALVDEVCCIGDESRARDYLGQLEASGCTGAVLNLASITPEERMRTLEALAPAR